jgi:hypothetical protein
LSSSNLLAFLKPTASGALLNSSYRRLLTLFVARSLAGLRRFSDALSCCCALASSR